MMLVRKTINESIMSRKFTLLVCFTVAALICSAGDHSHTASTKLPFFSVTNEMAGGELRQVLSTTNGLSLYFTASDLVVWFGRDSAIVVEFDAATHKPLNILLKRPASGENPVESIFDINADGVPEIKKVHGGATNYLLYRGEWFATHAKGPNQVITADGRELEVHFDGNRFRAVTNGN